MASDTLTRKEIKKPDEFQVALARALDWAMAHARQLALAAGALAAVALIAVVIAKKAAATEARVGASLSEALSLAARPVVKGENPSELPPDARAYFQSEEEKSRVVAEALDKVRAEAGDGPARWLATLQLANLRAREGRYAEAIRLYEEALAAAPQEDALRASALEGLGYAYEAEASEGWYDKASAVFARLGTEAGMGDRARYHEARLLDKVGKKDEARGAYTALAADPESPLAQRAQERLALLDLPPAPPKQSKAPSAPAPRKGGKQKAP